MEPERPEGQHQTNQLKCCENRRGEEIVQMFEK